MKKIAIIDIDGTISKVPEERLKYALMVHPDWDSYDNHDFDDEPIQPILRLINTLSNSYQIVFCTARSERTREKTLEWLKINYSLFISNKDLIMRPDGDKRHDVIVKPEMLGKCGIQLHDIALVLEDRNSMVKKWRELGLTVLQVADGDF